MVGKTDSLEHAKRNDGGGGTAAANGGSLGRTASTPGRTLTPAGAGCAGARTVGASPTGSLTKTAKLAAADSSSTSSLEKKSRVSLQASDAEAPQRSVGSKESLASQGISEVVSGNNLERKSFINLTPPLSDQELRVGVIAELGQRQGGTAGRQ